MRYKAAALFSLFLHEKNRGTREQKREERLFKILIKHFCNGNWKKVSRMSFREVVVLLAPRIIENDTSFRKATPVEKRVGLWRLETGNSYRCIAKMFVIGESTAVKISKDFCSVLRKSCTYIKFPDSAVVT